MGLSIIPRLIEKPLAILLAKLLLEQSRYNERSCGRRLLGIALLYGNTLSLRQRAIHELT